MAAGKGTYCATQDFVGREGSGSEMAGGAQPFHKRISPLRCPLMVGVAAVEMPLPCSHDGKRIIDSKGIIDS